LKYMGLNGEIYPGIELAALRGALETEIPDQCRACHLPRSIIARGIQEMHALKDDVTAKSIREDRLRLAVKSCFQNSAGVDCPGPADPYYAPHAVVHAQQADTNPEVMSYVQCQAFATTNHFASDIGSTPCLPDDEAYA